jgi:DNA-directed RNA polymerase subunit RPC12/RpoP
MQMGMSLRLTQRMTFICALCDKEADDHADWCPQPKIEALVASQKFYSCPDCHRRSVEVNTGDYFECRECRSVFSAGAAGYVEGEPTFTMFEQGNDSFDSCRKVWRLDGFGNGEFRVDVQLKPLLELRNRIRSRKKHKKRKRKRKEMKNGARGSNR